ncbi:MAG: class I SAM-dependent methyltransferase [Peptococcaceae bacterium]|nr:class I SAM-dependent methyltransferase [Peptococcaceae bacterium]
MEENQISRTAMGSAHVRAYHAMNDSPKIFDDFLAYSLLKEEEREAFKQFLAATLQSDDPVRAALFPDQATASAWMMQMMASVPISLCRTRYG